MDFGNTSFSAFSIAIISFFQKLDDSYESISQSLVTSN